MMIGLHLGGFALIVFLDLCRATDVTVTVSSTASHAIPTTLWGLTFEASNDVNHVRFNSGDGGLYGELLKNRAFQKVTPNTPEALDGWHSIGGAGLTVIADTTPVSPSLPNSLQVTFPSGKILPVGFGNEGYFGGIKVDTTATYSVSFFYRFPTASSFRGNAVVGMQTSTGLSLGSTTVAISGAQTTWLQVIATFRQVQAPFNNNNFFSITLDGTAAAGQTVNFAMLSLAPPLTFGNAAVRVDIGAVLTELQPGFLRFPGGKNLGNSIADRWQWNATVGALVNRPGRMGSYGYVNTDGLGLFELLTICEDLGAKPIMAVYSGLSLDGEAVPEADILPYIQQAIDQINFAIGPTTTVQGAQRATLGHSAPFALNWVEIGNEDFMSSDTYLARWQDFVTILSQKFPQLRFIASSNVNNPILAPDPTHWDVHMFQTPSWFAQNSMYYDGFQRNGTMYLEGEYAATTSNDGGSGPAPLTFPTVESALGEAAFMTGIERNSDIVFGAAYSPLLNNVGSSQQSPSLIGFDIDSVYRSTSFYVQKLFSTNRPVSYVPSTIPDPNGSVFWSVGTTANPAHLFKVVNIGNTPVNVTFVLPFTVASGTITVLTGSPTVSNSPSSPSAVVPVATTTTLAATRSWVYVAPPFSLSIMRV
ncbi:glycoside hydrolase family 51 protein [Crucibulum laeve]|uniref:non-reducing end alpha-L-arabinofuranosidase n=1 Tax=Crucibulum laeve TaxID=68775 RepID=A0A5C3LZA4_9AGAR|nr:glycoside hydrolase family 51 protein [Crucibulum laeve]